MWTAQPTRDHQSTILQMLLVAILLFAKLACGATNRHSGDFEVEMHRIQPIHCQIGMRVWFDNPSHPIPPVPIFGGTMLAVLPKSDNSSQNTDGSVSCAKFVADLFFEILYISGLKSNYDYMLELERLEVLSYEMFSAFDELRTPVTGQSEAFGIPDDLHDALKMVFPWTGIYCPEHACFVVPNRLLFVNVISGVAFISPLKIYHYVANFEAIMQGKQKQLYERLQQYGRKHLIKYIYTRFYNSIFGPEKKQVGVGPEGPSTVVSIQKPSQTGMGNFSAIPHDTLAYIFALVSKQDMAIFSHLLELNKTFRHDTRLLSSIALHPQFRLELWLGLMHNRIESNLMQTATQKEGSFANLLPLLIEELHHRLSTTVPASDGDMSESCFRPDFPVDRLYKLCSGFPDTSLSDRIVYSIILSFIRAAECSERQVFISDLCTFFRRIPESCLQSNYIADALTTLFLSSDMLLRRPSIILSSFNTEEARKIAAEYSTESLNSDNRFLVLQKMAKSETIFMD